MDEWEILKGFPTITAAQLHDAISYDHDHKEEMEEFIQANEKAYYQYLTEQKGKKVAENQVVS